MRVGAIGTRGHYQFNGCIVDVKFYDVALDEGEVYFAFNGIGGGDLESNSISLPVNKVKKVKKGDMKKFRTSNEQR